MTFPLVYPKDPEASRLIQWDISAEVAALDTTLVSATITEVDVCDDEVDTATVTIGVPTVTATGYVTALVSGGTAGCRVYLRCRYELANGETDDATLILPIKHR